MPEVINLSYSHSKARQDTRAFAAQKSHILRGATVLETIDCRNWNPPPPDLCRRYSGVSQPLQTSVFRQEPRGWNIVSRAANQAIQKIKRERIRGRVALVVFCMHGTHRSVTVAEYLARPFECEGWDVSVVHMHRQRMPGDRR